jgi:hypothetical protein
LGKVDNDSANLLQNTWTTSNICLANSWLGVRIRPAGPSPTTKGKRISSSKAAITMGNVNVIVFPDPVNAVPTIVDSN